MKRFDPYHTWLGIPPEEQPPNHYRLLGISLFESDRDVIRNAADQRMTYLKTYGGGQHSELSQQLLNEVSAAKVCLVNADKKAAYDAWLRQQLEPSVAERVPTESVEPESAEEEQLPPIVTKPKRAPPRGRRNKDRSFPRRGRPRLPVLGIVVAVILVLLFFWLIFPSDHGTLTLKIEPVGVPRDIHVKVDGKVVKKFDVLREPRKMQMKLAPEQHEIVVSGPDFRPQRRLVRIQAGEETTLTVALVRPGPPVCGVKIVLSDPSADVQVKVDGNPIETPRLKDRLELDPGEHELHVSGPDYLDVRRRFVVESGRKTLPVPLVPAGTVKIRFNEPNADVQVKIDGELVAVPDIGSALKLKAGEHTISVAGSGYQAVNRDFIIEQGEQTVLDVRLKRGHSGSSRDEPPLALAPFDEATAKKHQRTWADYLGLPVEKDIDVGEGVSMSFVLIPPGEFMMGSQDSAIALAEDYEAKPEFFAHEYPRHHVRITKPYYLGMHEVTQGQWEKLMGTEPWRDKSYARANSNHAVSYVCWYDAVEFCNTLSEQEGLRPCYRLSSIERENDGTIDSAEVAPVSSDTGYRLPTEAQWEYACRAGTTTRFCFGDDESKLGDYAWFDHNANDVDEEYAHPVGQKKANSSGLYDMHGNVWEWCDDRYDHGYYEDSPVDDPSGPTTGACRLFRGGAWDCNAWDCRSAERSWLTPGRRSSYRGFRVALVPAR